MQFGYHIAKRLSFNTQHSFTKTITSLAITAVSISVFVVILAFGILLGFKKEIREKVRGYAGDITVTKYQLASGNETNLFKVDPLLIMDVGQQEPISSIYPIIQKAGILKSDSTVEGVVFKGVPAGYDFSFYAKHLIKGNIPKYTDSTDSYDILVSNYTASILDLDTGSLVNLYFIDQSNVRRRRPRIVGIFDTGLKEFDKQFALADIRSIQRIIGNNYTNISGYEVKINNQKYIDICQSLLEEKFDYNYAINSIRDLYPAMFQWLDIVDTNVAVIITLMFLVAIINMSTMLLILIIDRIPMIGILKSMGAESRKIGSIFNWQGGYILVGGLIAGNIVALSFAFLQNKYKLISLNADTYYMDAVPFFLPFEYLIIINLGALILSFIFTYIPVRLIHKIEPTRSIQFK